MQPTWNQRIEQAVDWFRDRNLVPKTLTISRDIMASMRREAEINPASVPRSVTFMGLRTGYGYQLRFFILPAERDVAFMTSACERSVCPLMRRTGDAFPPPRVAGLMPQAPFNFPEATWRPEDMVAAYGPFVSKPIKIEDGASPPTEDDILDLGKDEEE